MIKNNVSVLILISGIFISGGIISQAHAQTATPSDIQYPISELGSCKSKNDCKVFCDNPKNSDACLAFAEQHSLMSSEELSNAKKFADTGMVGPGSCKGQVACEQYCSNSAHLEECTAFAKENGMMTDQQVQDSEKVIAAIKNGLKPPACSGPKQCETYCSSSAHMEECMTFSLAAGIVPDNQKEQMQKTLDAIKKGAKPPACQPNPPSDQLGKTNQSNNGLQSCDEYCGTHQEECMSFSLATGMVPDDQKEQMQKTLDVLKQGIKPPACQPNPPSQDGAKNQPNKPSQSGQGLQACDAYCAEPSHVEECVKFSVAIGNMTEEQGQNSIKNGNKGPGGCIGKDACDTFCNNPDNQDACFNFAKDNGMIPEGDLQKMQAGQQKMKDSFSSIPPEVLDCITSSLGADVVEKMKTGSMIGRQNGDAINQCFQKSGVQEKRPGQNQNGQDQQNQNQPGQEQSNQSNQQIMPWADMCKPDANGNPTALACVDGSGNFVASAKVGSDGKPVCPTDSTAKCGNYQQQNQQGQSGQMQPGQLFREKLEPNQSGQPGSAGVQNKGQSFNPGGQQMPQQAGPGGCKGPEECQKYCASNPEVCKNFQPQQSQPNQQGQRLLQQQPGQPNQGVTNVGPCGTGPGTCSGIGPDDIQGSGGAGGSSQPGQMQPDQQLGQTEPQQPESQPIQQVPE